MSRRKSYSVSSRLTWMNMIVSGAALLLAGAAFLAYDLVTFRQTMARNLSIQAEIIGSTSVSALEFDLPGSAEATMSALKVSPSILSAAIYTKDHRPFAVYPPDSPNRMHSPPEIPPGKSEVYSFENDRLILGKAIEFQGKTSGFVYIESDLRELNERLKRYAGIVAGILMVSLLAALLISTLSKRAISTPVVHLAEMARVVSREKNYSLRATPIHSRSELAELIDAFNEMLSQIQERDGALEKARDELEHRVAERTAELASVNKELEAFSYSVSHDLRAPLRHIDGFSMILAQKYGPSLDPAAQKYLKRIRDGAKHMGQLVDDLLAMARIGRQEVIRKSVDVHALVEGAVQELQPEYDGRRIQWKVGKLPVLYCDPNLMKIVFVNLLSNAVKYTRKREDAVIEVGHFSQDDRIVIFVRDNGAGFEQEYAHKLFGVFQRLHRADDFEGTGVGLATVQRVIHNHHGQIWAEGKVDEGAAFFFTLGGA
jgi:signal transduction histidine kinase